MMDTDKDEEKDDEPSSADSLWLVALVCGGAYLLWRFVFGGYLPDFVRDVLDLSDSNILTSCSAAAPLAGSILERHRDRRNTAVLMDRLAGNESKYRSSVKLSNVRELSQDPTTDQRTCLATSSTYDPQSNTISDEDLKYLVSWRADGEPGYHVLIVTDKD